MFGLFGKRKPAETPTEEPPIIQGQADGSKQSNGDDFIFVERKTDGDAATATGGMVYPPMPQSAYGPMPYPPALGPRPPVGGAAGPAANAPINYLQDIPFQLSPQLASKERFSGTQTQVDGILAFLTRQMSVDALADEYSFSLERAVQNDCF
ncbi:hypothetical protein KR222_011384 [Zaprionus bogoriensis]|nr:hypothetical protein KR222_011384 [Zaprionus bogoriensis]